MRSHLLEGKVRHRRARPFVYALEHDVFYVALDLDELDLVGRKLRLVSRNRPNVLSFRDEDHLEPPAHAVSARPDWASLGTERRNPRSHRLDLLERVAPAD